ncbi:MAG: hypothetical protein AABY87_01265 [bacterium]
MVDQTVKTETIVINRSEVVQTRETPYLLHDGDFLRLTKIPSFVAIWAHSFFAGTGVFFVTLIAKLIDHNYFSAATSVSTLEWITFVILITLVIIFELINWRVPSDKKKTMKKIEAFYEKHKQD